MPFARCSLFESSLPDPEVVVEKWAALSGTPQDEMTVIFQDGLSAGGKKYRAIVELFLPSLWSPETRASLLKGLGHALAEVLGVQPRDVLILMRILESGHVLEDGQILTWE